MIKYADPYALNGNTVNILATSLASIKGRVMGALREIKWLKVDDFPDCEVVRNAYNKHYPYRTGDLYDEFYCSVLPKEKRKAEKIAETICELHNQITLDYHLPDPD